MWYWNQANFEGLSAVANAIADEDPWHEFADYLRLREQGLRKQSLAVINRLIDESARWSAFDRRRFADWIYGTQLRFADVHQLVVTPLNQKLLIPTLREWAVSEPENEIPRRWLGFATGDHEHFIAALSLNPRDDISRYRLVTRHLADVEYQCHHLPEYFIGDPHDALSTLQKASELGNGFVDSAIMPRLAEEFADLSAKVTDWLAFHATNRDSSFADWCVANGRVYQWVQTYYYSR